MGSIFMNTDIVMIDTYIKEDALNMSNIIVSGNFCKKEIPESDKKHGTIICGIIQQVLPSVKIHIIPVDWGTDIDTFVKVLKYASTFPSKVLNLSCGVMCKSNALQKRINRIINKILDNGTKIVCASSSEDNILPACCLGVYSVIELKKSGVFHIHHNHQLVREIKLKTLLITLQDGTSSTLTMTSSFIAPVVSCQLLENLY